MEHLSLLAGGRAHSVADWEREAAAVLRKAGRLGADEPDAAVWDKLTRTTLDGIRVTPLGLPRDLVPADADTRGIAVDRQDLGGDVGWDVRAHLADPDPTAAAEAASTDLENGVTSLWLTVGRGGTAVDELPAVLRAVYLDLAPVVLESLDAPVEAAEAYVALLQARGASPAPGTNLGGDPLGAAVRGVRQPVEEVVTRLARLAQDNGTRALVVDATPVHDAWATEAQELGYSMAAGVAYLRMLVATGLDVRASASLLEFRYAATVEQFATIAKLRAARRLWRRVLELSGAAEAGVQVQHAVTSRPMTTKHDPWVNMLRGTVAAFAAGAGGAASVTVLPYDSAIGVPDAFGRRIARNISSLLVHESHVAKVADPAGGAYAVEKVTDDLAQAAWAELQRIESEGGVEASLAKGEAGLTGRITAHGREPRLQQVRTRQRPITGVSEFPDLTDTLPVRRPLPPTAGAASFDRYASEFEAMRDDPVDLPVFLATMGTVAAHTSRATFAHNLFAAGGVDTVSAGATESVADVVKAYDGQPVVCLCGTDAAYADWGADLAEKLRDAGASYVVLAGRPRDGIDVDDSASLGMDAVAFLARVRKELGR